VFIREFTVAGQWHPVVSQYRPNVIIVTRMKVHSVKVLIISTWPCDLDSDLWTQNQDRTMRTTTVPNSSHSDHKKI